MQYKGAVLAAVSTLLVAQRALGFDIGTVKTLDQTVGSCYEAREMLKADTYSFELIIRKADVEDRGKGELMKFPNRLPVAIRGYLKTTDQARLAKAKKMERIEYAPPIEESEHDFMHSAITGLQENYSSAQGKKDLETLIAVKGEKRAKAELREKYRSVVEKTLDGASYPGGLQYRKEILSLYFKQVGPDKYNAEARKRKDDWAFLGFAYRQLVEVELDKIDFFSRYRGEQAQLALKKMIGDDNLRSIFKESLIQTKSGKGTLEENLRRNGSFAKLMENYPQDKLSDLLDYRIVEKDMEVVSKVQARKPFSWNMAAFEEMHDSILIVFPDRNAYLDTISAAFRGDESPSEIKVSVSAGLRCMSKEDVQARALRLISPSSYPIQLDFETVADAIVAKYAEGNHGSVNKMDRMIMPTGRGYYFLAREYKVQQPESEAKVLSDERPQ